MQSKPLISVIIPVYNQQKYLALTIESVLAQTFTDFELILINDGSTDESAKIIAQYAARDSRIKAIHIDNSGKPEAINHAASLARGELFAFMDHDDLMMPERLDYQAKYLHQNAEVSAVSCSCQYVNENGITMGIQRYGKPATPEESKSLMQRKQRIMCSFTALTVHKAAFEKVGGLRSKYWPSDDVDFINRLPQNGLLLVILPKILVKYRIHSLSTTSSNQWHLFRMAEYTNLCIDSRNENRAEPTFKQYTAMRATDSRIMRLKRYAHNHAILLLQQANFHLTLKNPGRFISCMMRAFILDPKYVLVNVRKRLTLKAG